MPLTRVDEFGTKGYIACTRQVRVWSDVLQTQNWRCMHKYLFSHAGGTNTKHEPSSLAEDIPNMLCACEEDRIQTFM